MDYEKEFVPEIKRLFEGWNEPAPTGIRMEAVFDAVRRYDRRDLRWAVTTLLGFGKFPYDLGKSLAEACEKAAGERRKVEVERDKAQADQALQTVRKTENPLADAWALLHTALIQIPRNKRADLVRAWLDKPDYRAYAERMVVDKCSVSFTVHSGLHCLEHHYAMWCWSKRPPAGRTVQEDQRAGESQSMPTRKQTRVQQFIGDLVGSMPGE